MPHIAHGPPAQAGVQSLQYLSGGEDVPQGTPVSHRSLWLVIGLGGVALASWGPRKLRNYALAASALALFKV